MVENNEMRTVGVSQAVRGAAEQMCVISLPFSRKYHGSPDAPKRRKSMPS
jgi:hypothetical protein